MDLTPYAAIQSNLFVEITIYDDTGVDEIIRLSDYWRTISIDGDSYTGLGQFMNITDSAADLRITPYELSISISGIPSSNISTFGESRIKGSTVAVKRALFNPTTGVLLAIAGNPAGRFNGIINNYALNEEYPEDGGKDSTCTITLICASTINVLQAKISGRATNPEDQKALYPTDLSMDRVPNISNSNFNFGAPR
jgi:hypothetical protein